MRSKIALKRHGQRGVVELPHSFADIILLGKPNLYITRHRFIGENIDNAPAHNRLFPIWCGGNRFSPFKYASLHGRFGSSPMPSHVSIALDAAV